MKQSNYNKQYQHICNYLSQRKLKPAFDVLEQLLLEYNLGVFNDELRTLGQTYRYMLQYTVEGIQDPSRQKVYRKLIVSVFKLADKVHDALNMQKSSALDYEMKRTFVKGEHQDLSTLIDELESFYAVSELKKLAEDVHVKEAYDADKNIRHTLNIERSYAQMLFKNELTSADVNLVDKFLNSRSIPAPYKSVFLTTIILSLLRYFDEEKFNLLFNAYNSKDIQLSQRAIVGLLIVSYKYDSRLDFYPEIISRYKLLGDTTEFKKQVERIVIQFIRTKETEKIQKKIRDEIMPEMIKISPNLRNKVDLESLMEDELSDDKNPDWQDILKDSPGLFDKMEEFSKLQMEGADVFMSSFAMLKSIPFFNKLYNWFIPFFIDHPEIGESIDLNDELNINFLNAIEKAPILCNSDKYSFCFSIKNLPKENREFMAEGMKAEMDQFTELEKDESLTSPNRQAEFVSNQFVQDLYRFYKLHPRKNDFEDIFSWNFDFHNLHTIGAILKSDSNLLRNIAEYYFSKAHYTEASEIFEFLLYLEKHGELYQKIAFCFQKEGNYQKALDAYQNAELYDLNKLWNYRKVALCYRNLKQPEQALEYYRLAEKIDSEDLSIQLNIGQCLLELKKFNDALKCYFRIEYLAPGNKKVWRPIAWCSFVCGKKDQAEKYYTKLVKDSPNKNDLLNMGHVQWALGSRKEALDYYKKSISELGYAEDEFFDVIEEDLPILLEQGIDKDDVPIMLDQLRYSVE